MSVAIRHKTSNNRANQFEVFPLRPDEFRRLRRGTLDMTQDQLAEAIGVSRTTITAIERADGQVETRYELAIRYLAGQVAGLAAE